MVEFHPQILKKDGREQFVILPHEEYVALQERMEDLEDLVDLLRAKIENADEPTIPIAEIMRKYGVE